MAMRNISLLGRVATLVLMIGSFSSISVLSQQSGGGMMGRGPMGGGPENMNRMNEMCENDSDTCDLMNEVMSYCKDNAEYCELSGLPAMKKPGENGMQDRGSDRGPGMGGGRMGGSGSSGPGPGGPPPDMGEMGDMIRSCSNEESECEELKESVRQRLADAKDLKILCESDSEECEIAKSELREALQDVKPRDIPNGMGQKSEPVCEDTEEECERQMLERREKELEEMQERCRKNLEKCKRNTIQKREFCNEHPDECDTHMLKMLDEMESIYSEEG